MPRFFLPRHGRTHCPGGSDPIPPDCLQSTRPWFRQMLTFAGTDSPLTIGFLDSDTLVFDDFDFGDGGDDYFSVVTGPDRFGVASQMWVGLTAEVWWDDDPVGGDVQFQIHDGGSVSAGFSFNPFGTQSGSTQAVHFEWRSTGTSIEIKVANNHPSLPRNILAAYVELSYLGGWTGTDPHTSDPDF